MEFEAYVLLGTNMEPKVEHLQAAEALLLEKFTLLKRSSYYWTEAWGGQTEESFVNQVLCLGGRGSAHELLHDLLRIENTLGRVRDPKLKYGARTIDLDLLFFNDVIIQEEGLEVPHPRLHLRRFTLSPLMELSPNFLHPVFNLTINELSLRCKDNLIVKPLKVD